MSIKPTPTILCSGRRLSGRRLSSQEFVLFSINHVFIREQIGRQFGAPLALRVKLVSENHDQIQRDSEICRDEIDMIEFLFPFAGFLVDKHIEIFEEKDYDAKYQGEISSREAQWRRECQFMVFDVLSLTRFDKTNVRHQNGDPSQKAECDDEIENMPEDFDPFIDHIEEGNADH